MNPVPRFARKSTHVHKAETGTATWEEFDGGLRVQHSEHEREYTPDVFDAFKVLDWDAETDALGDELGEYRDVKMSSMFPICNFHFRGHWGDSIRLSL